MRYNFLIIFLLITLNMYSQPALNKVSVNPVQLLGYNQLNMEYERSFMEGKWGGGFNMRHTGNASPRIHGQYSQLSEENIFFKRYVRRYDRNSLWYGAMLAVASGEIYSDNGADKASNIGALGLLGIGGYQFIIRSLYLTPYAGAGYAITNDLFGSAEFTGNIGKPTKGLLTYGLKAGICF